jgi:spermidine/putrescine-binding protein
LQNYILVKKNINSKEVPEMKKLLSLVLVTLLSITLFACESRTTMYVLNWGDYINQDLIAAFEEEYSVRIVLEEVDSNESIYERISSANTPYDVTFPSDYMVERMISEGMLLPIDNSKVGRQVYFDIVNEVTESIGAEDYTRPYFFGSIGILYNLEYKDVVEEYGWEVFFNPSILPAGTRVAMYDSSRDAVAVALLHLGYSVNTTDAAELREAEQLLKDADYTLWGTDNLKTQVVNKNIGISFAYSGDFFDQLYITLEEELEVTYDFFIPEDNNLWVDYMVVPNTSKNQDLANIFINFMSRPENALINVSYVGYPSALRDVYDMMLEDEEGWGDITSRPEFIDVYFSDSFKGEVYKYLGRDHAQELEEILNRVKE